MDRNRLPAVLLGAALMLSGCDFFDSALLPSFGGESSNSTPTATQTAQASTPQLGTGNFQPPGVTPGQATGTAVGQKVEGLRGELSKLQGSVSSENQNLQSLRAQAIQNALAYHQSVGAINEARGRYDSRQPDPG